RVIYAPLVHEFLLSLTSRKTFDHITRIKNLLKSTPDMGRVYEPSYPATRPAIEFECRIIAVDWLNLYYSKNEAAQQIEIFFIESQR
ncbi:MAG: hypothetical protein RSA89_06465, partial [Raoultibacter sp.]